jgi:hypothetical protein
LRVSTQSSHSSRTSYSPSLLTSRTPTASRHISSYSVIWIAPVAFNFSLSHSRLTSASYP